MRREAASLGNEYVVGLKTVNCQSGEPLAQEQVTASSKEKVLDAVGDAAAKLRRQLGESLTTVGKFDVRLSEATTSSLEALKSYSIGKKVAKEKGAEAALCYDQRAIQLDPNFAMGYSALGNDYTTLSELERADEYYRKAFDLREHASERERLWIASDYYLGTTGELDKEAVVDQELIESYPRDSAGYGDLGVVYSKQGQYEKALDMARQALRLDPPAGIENVVNYLLALQRFGEAKQAIQQAMTQRTDNFILHGAIYALAFLTADPSTVEEQQRWFAGKSQVEHYGLSFASDTEAYAGRLHKARELSQRSVDSAIRSDSKENAGVWLTNAAVREAAFGNFPEARQYATAGLKLAAAGQGAQVEAALAYAMAGDTTHAAMLATELHKRYPLDTQMQSLGYLPFRRSRHWTTRIPQPPLLLCRLLSHRLSTDLPFSRSTHAFTQPTFVVRPISRLDKARRLPPSSRRFSTTAASYGTAGRGRWRDGEWRGRMLCRRRTRRGRKPMLPACGRSLRTTTS